MNQPSDKLNLDRLAVVLVDTRNPLNLGAAARALSNFGFEHLRVVRPYEPSFREARSAVGASELLARAKEFASVPDAIADCTFVVGTTAAHNREMRQPLHGLDSAGQLIRSHLQKGRVAMLFGSEKRGLSNADLAHCHCLVRIPTRIEHGSMNVGQAVAVCLYELIREGGARPAQLEFGVSASQADVERLTSVWLDALRASGYVPSGGGGTTEEKVRRLVRRLNFQTADAEVLLGMLRQIVWKLHANEKTDAGH
jgi:tRNA/rRNA methyltransferase